MKEKVNTKERQEKNDLVGHITIKKNIILVSKSLYYR